MKDKLPRTEVYQGHDGQWYWRYRARNGYVSATGGEAYSTESNAKRAARRIGAALALSRVAVIKPNHLQGDYRG